MRDLTDEERDDSIERSRAEYDALMRPASEYRYRCGTCDKPIKTGCYCSKECADADE